MLKFYKMLKCDTEIKYLLTHNHKVSFLKCALTAITKTAYSLYPIRLQTQLSSPIQNTPNYQMINKCGSLVMNHPDDRII